MNEGNAGRPFPTHDCPSLLFCLATKRLCFTRGVKKTDIQLDKRERDGSKDNVGRAVPGSKMEDAAVNTGFQ